MNRASNLVSIVALSWSTAASAAPIVFNYTGAIETFTITTSGNYLMTALGASGGENIPTGGIGGLGGKIQDLFALNVGDTLSILVGGQGQTVYSNSGTASAGGGGSFVASNGGVTPLLVAGGAGIGGQIYGESSQGQSGGQLLGGSGDGGMSGYIGAQHGSGGGGFYSSGGSTTLFGGGGSSFLSGGSGGNSPGLGNGGFGGGGGGAALIGGFGGLFPAAVVVVGTLGAVAGLRTTAATAEHRSRPMKCWPVPIFLARAASIWATE